MKHSFRFIYDYFCYFNRLWNNRRYGKWKRVRWERESWSKSKSTKPKKKEYNSIFFSLELSFHLLSALISFHLLLQIPELSVCLCVCVCCFLSRCAAVVFSSVHLFGALFRRSLQRSLSLFLQKIYFRIQFILRSTNRVLY